MVGSGGQLPVGGDPSDVRDQALHTDLFGAILRRLSPKMLRDKLPVGGPFHADVLARPDRLPRAAPASLAAPAL